MLEMTILETQIFNIFWENITPDILRTVAPTALVVPPTHPTPPPFWKSYIRPCIPLGT